MLLSEKSCTDFTEQLASKAPVPGGGGAAALAGALGTALASMVCNLTTGKKKYAQYEPDIQHMLERAADLQGRLLELIDEDAENFYPLSQAYGLPKNTEEEKAYKEKTMQECLKVAIKGPVEMIRVACEAVDLQEELVEKGSRLAISDVGCGAVLLKSSIQSAWLNVVINLKSIKDEAFCKDLRAELTPMMHKACRTCDEVYDKVLQAMGE